MQFSVLILQIFFLISNVGASTCPMQKLIEAGLLKEADAAKFDAVKRQYHADNGVINHLQKNSPTAALRLQPRLVEPILNGILDFPLGGGLLNGVLQPLMGVLANLKLPTPQPTGLKAIPGNDPNHQYIRPSGNDIRGVCPTLNTLANHGYISRSGITNFAEAANAVQIGYGFSYDLAVVLAALGVIAGGDLTNGQFSIGGADNRVSNTLGPSLGLDKHGTFEVDSSITREDAYFGNQANFHSDRWNNLNQIRTQHSDGTFGAKTWKYESGMVYDQSRATNPQFNAGPKWLLVGFGARAFVYRGLPNGTNQNVADYNNVAPFFLNETFPANWYRRSTPYTTIDFLTDAADIYANPGTGSPREFGANEGLGNFVPLNLNITTKTPSELGCFLLEEILDNTPGFAEGTFVNNIGVYEGFVKGVIAPFFDSNGCNFSSYAEPSASAGESNTGSLSADGPAIVNGVYQPNS